MEFVTTINGNYPKICDRRDAVNLRSVLNRFDAGRADAPEVEAAYRETIARVIAEQEHAGLDWVTDGQIRWDDPVTPFVGNCRGFNLGGLIRLFDNNVYYRRPVIRARPVWTKPAAAPGYEFAVAHAGRPVKAALVGPYTFARLALDEYFHDVEACAQALAEILNQELAALERAGAQWVQIDEPSLGFFPQDIQIARRAWETMLAGRSIRTILYTCFGDVRTIADDLFSFPADVIGADVVSQPGNFDILLRAPQERKLMFGLIDARNTKLEPLKDLRGALDRIAGARTGTCGWITTSCGLEFLPHINALAKMRRMTEAVRTVNASVGAHP